MDIVARMASLLPGDAARAITGYGGALTEIRAIEDKTPQELFEALYEQQNGQSMSEAQREICDTLMQQIWKEQA